MAENKLKDISTEELQKKKKNLKAAIFVFIPITIGLLYFQVRNYLNYNEIDWAMLTIVICTFSDPATLYPELKKVEKELDNRSI